MVEGCQRECCPGGSDPALPATYEARGIELKLGDLPVYTIGEGKSAVVVNYDIYGFDGGRTRQICDKIAEQGYYVILPDYYRGEPYPTNAELSKELLTSFFHTFPIENLNADLEANLLPHLNERGVQKIGLLGFCWGAWLNLHFSAKYTDFTCVANVHPSYRIEEFFGRNETDLAKEVTCPQLIYAAGNDYDKVKDDGEILQILKSKEFANRNDFRHFPDVNHGWTNRGDLTKPEVARDAKLAIEGVIAFFKANLPQRERDAGNFFAEHEV